LTEKHKKDSHYLSQLLAAFNNIKYNLLPNHLNSRLLYKNHKIKSYLSIGYQIHRRIFKYKSRKILRPANPALNKKVYGFIFSIFS